MNRLPQDAADTLQANERQQKWRAAAKANHERANPAPINGCAWFPPITEQERAERAQQIADGILPF